MARTARAVDPGVPLHIIQRGNRSQAVFFTDDDKKYYLQLLYQYGKKYGIAFWAYCLMENHVHLITVPESKTSLATGLGDTHRRYTRMINFREGWRGYLWQGRFISYPLDERHLYAAVRYIENNPVRAGIVKEAEDYPWSSAKDHIDRSNNRLLSDFYLLSQIKDWRAYLSSGDTKSTCPRITTSSF